MNRRKHGSRYLSAGERKVEWLKGRSANAHILLDNGRSVSYVTDDVLLDPDTVRS